MSINTIIKYGRPFLYVWKKASSVVSSWFWGDDEDGNWGDNGDGNWGDNV
jgi:hypothetical protein